MLQSMGSQKVRHDLATEQQSNSNIYFIYLLGYTESQLWYAGSLVAAC